MIKNLTALRDLLRNYIYIKIGEDGVKFDKESYEKKEDVKPEKDDKEKADDKEKEKAEELLGLPNKKYDLQIITNSISNFKEILPMGIVKSKFGIKTEEEEGYNPLKIYNFLDLLEMLEYTIEEFESKLSEEELKELNNLRNKFEKVQNLYKKAEEKGERDAAKKRMMSILNKISKIIKNALDRKQIGAGVSNESIDFNKIDDYLSFCLNEKNRFTKGNKSTIHNNEDYLKQSFIKIKKSIQVLEDSKDKGISINADFIDEILKEKMTAKKNIKKLFDEIYEHLYGKYAPTMQERDRLYKESVSLMVKNQKVVAEKMARFAKRAVQFEGEGFYSGLAVFGDNLETYNQTLIHIMKYVENKKKNTPKNESILLESRYKGVKLNLSKQLAKTIFKELEKKYKLMNTKY